MKKVKSGSDISFSFNVKVTDKTTVDEIIREASDIIKVRFAEYKVEPEESEDERARKWLVALVENLGDPADEEAEKELEVMRPLALAYLEKQKDHFRDDTKKVEKQDYSGLKEELLKRDELKEQKPAKKEITLNGFEKVLDSFLFDFVHSPIIDCEPKEYIKNHSAYLLKAAYKELNAQLKQDFFEAQQEGRREGYEAAMAEQKPAKWSEEDENMLQRIIRHTESEYQDWCNDKYGNSEIVSDGKRSCLERLDWLEKRLKSLRPQSHKEIYQVAKRDLTIKFMNYLDENRPEGKMSLSNGECEDIDKAFKEGDWAKIIRYIKKYQPHWKPSKEQMRFLLAVINEPNNAGSESCHLVLKGLYEQLKNL